MDSRVKNYEEALSEIAKREGVICLSQHDQCQFNGENALQLSSDVLSFFGDQKEKSTSVFLDIIYSLSPGINFSIKNVYLYLSGINNFTLEENYLNGHPTYDQTLEEKRFLYFSEIAIEKLYSFWNRIGDLLNIAFDLKIPEKDIYFSKVIDEINKNHKDSSSSNFLWFQEFKKMKYRKLNEERKKIVHYQSYYPYFFKKWSKGRQQKSEDGGGSAQYWKKLQKEKEDLPSFLKDHLRLAIEGFEKMIHLIKEKNIS